MLGTKKLPNIIFWIKPTQAEKWGNKKRQSDLYIYCWLKHKQTWSIDPKDPVVVAPTNRLIKT